MRVTCRGFLTAVCVLAAAAGARADDQRVTGEIAVELVPGADAAAYAEQYHCTIKDAIVRWQLYLMVAPPGSDVDAYIAAMRRDPRTVEIEPHESYELPEGVQRTVGQLDRQATSDMFRTQPAAALIRTQAAQQRAFGAGVIVALLDSGVSFGHAETKDVLLALPDAGVLGGGPAGMLANGEDDDADGLVDEGLQHGNLVAGAIHLAAPQARLLPVRVLDDEGRGTEFALAKGIVYAVDHGADVINFSLGMVTPSKIVGRAVHEARYAGVVMVGAAGNRGAPELDYPAGYGDVIAVAAVDDARVATPWTSYGSKVALSAPGEAVLSTYGDEGYGRWDGTSFAAPLVAGGVALLLGRYPGLSESDVRNVLRDTAQPDANPPPLEGLMGAGVLDLDGIAHATTSDRTSVRLAHGGVTTVSWTEVENATAYDLARGDVANLRALDATRVDLGPLRCVVNDTGSTAVAGDDERPAAGRAFFYVFRDDADAAFGYGKDYAWRVRQPSGGDCAPGP